MKKRIVLIAVTVVCAFGLPFMPLAADRWYHIVLDCGFCDDIAHASGCLMGVILSICVVAGVVFSISHAFKEGGG